MIERSADDYLGYLKAIFPPGRAYLRLTGLITTKVLGAYADALALFHNDTRSVFLDNIDPCNADINEQAWLRTTGVLNDPCLRDIDNCAEAQAVLQAGSTDFEGQEQAFYTYLLANRGIAEGDITFIYESEGSPVIFQYRPSRCGEERCGWTAEKDVTRYYMEIVIANAATYPGYDGTSASIPWVICLIDRFKPAHVVIEYTFT